MRNPRLPWGVRATLLTLAALGAILGCDVSLAPTEREKEPELLTISLIDGTTVRRGDLIDVTVALPEPPVPDLPREGTAGADAAEAAYTVEVELQGSDGTLVTSRTFPYRDGDVFPSLTLDDLELPSRQYRLVVRLFRDATVLKQRVAEFYYVGDEYELTEITSDAPSIHPGSTVGLTALLKVPEGANPILQWSWEGGTFARGELAEGLDSVPWVSPTREGIYSVTATLYPLGASNASVSLSTDVYVARVLEPIGELEPSRSYRGLYHLLGDLTDASAALGVGAFLEGERPPLVTRGRLVGYRLDGTGGFTVPAFLIPSKEGALEPFTVSFGFTPSQGPMEGTILRTATSDGTVELRVTLEQAGPWIVAELRRPEGTTRLAADASALRPDVRASFSFSLSPSVADPTPEAAASTPEGVLTARWFLDGLQAAVAKWAAPPLPTIGRGFATIGGPDSVHGILDEIGVYVRDAAGRPATDPDVFERSVLAQHGSSAVADGFDGMYLDSAYTVEGMANVDRGALALHPGSLLALPAFPVGEAGIRVSLDLAADLSATGGITLSLGGAGDTSALLSLTGAGELAIGDVKEIVRMSPTRELTVTLRPETDQVRVEIEGVSRAGSAAPVFLVAGGVPKAAVMLVKISNPPGADAPLLVDSYAIWPLQ